MRACTTLWVSVQHDADTAQSGAIRAGIGRIRLGGERRRPGRGAWQDRACHGQDAAHAAAAATDPSPAIASTGLIIPAARCVPETPVVVAGATSALVCPRRLRSERIRSRDRSSHAPPAAVDNRGARGFQRIQTRMGRARHRAAGSSRTRLQVSAGRAGLRAGTMCSSRTFVSCVRSGLPHCPGLVCCNRAMVNHLDCRSFCSSGVVSFESVT